MRVHCRLVDSLDVAKLRVLGARRGWLIESPDSMHVGFGRPLAAEVLDGGLASSSTLSVFNEIDVECDAGAARPIAFASAPFERGGPLRAWVPEHQVTVTPDGTISLLSRDPARATAA